jgi:cation:H+ antiporter
VTVLLLLAAFVLIILGAIGFTNAVEWLGVRLNLGTGAVGGLLAAVGTALPESLIPLVALIGSGGDREREQVAIGAVMGAPFLLATLAMLLVAGAARGFRSRRGERADNVEPHRRSAVRDLWFFLALFPVAIVLGAIGVPKGLLVAAAAALLVAYAVYVVRTARHGGETQDEAELRTLWFDTSRDDPPNVLQITLQFLVALAAIIAGAELFVGEVEKLAESLGIDVLLISLVLAPLATELPEKANSILWMREGKDELAIGNITGAMVFQATVPVALVMLLTDWSLDTLAVAAGVVALAGGVVAAWAVRRRHFGGAPSVAWAALLAGFAVLAVTA